MMCKAILLISTYTIIFAIANLRELWREENVLEQSVQSTREELGRAERNYRSTMSKVNRLISYYVYISVILY